MYISYFDFKKVLVKLDKEYTDIQSDESAQANQKFGLYGRQALRRVDEEVHKLIDSK